LYYFEEKRSQEYPQYYPIENGTNDVDRLNQVVNQARRDGK
jgi:hypothetical protein